MNELLQIAARMASLSCTNPGSRLEGDDQGRFWCAPGDNRDGQVYINACHGCIFADGTAVLAEAKTASSSMRSPDDHPDSDPE